MPFISIIIPTYNNEEHIEQAINSCFDSDFDNLEVIVINDASTDGAAAKLELLAEKHKGKIKTSHSEINIGPGPARNIGLEQAKGEYIMFLDGDDWFEPDAVKIVAEKLKEVEPDVLMFNHQRVWENGIQAPNLPNKYVTLKMKEQDISKPITRNKILKNLHCPCNKAYKTIFLKEKCKEFEPGYYEDFSWSIHTVINAENIAFTPSIIFNYRQRNGSITRSNSTKHFDIFKQIQIAKNELAKNKNKEMYSNNIYMYTRGVLFGIIKTGYRVPKEQNIKFMTQAYQVLKQLRTELNIKKFDIGFYALTTKNLKIFTLTQPRIKHIK